jgi:hypothetical protein
MLIPSKYSGYQAGIRLYPGGKGGSSAPPPDPRLVAAQIRSMGIQDQSIQGLVDMGRQMQPLQMQQMQFGLDSSRTAYDQSQQDRGWMLDRREGLTGLQDRMLADARDFDQGDRATQLAGQASADVNSAFASAQQQNTRGLSRMGVNPSSGRALDMRNQTSIAQAVAQSSASNKVREAARLEGYSLNDRASNALAGYPAMGMQASGSGANFGAAGLDLANSGLGGMTSGYSAAGQMAGQMGANASGMYGAQASYKNNQDQIAASNNPLNSILGAATGVGMSYAMKSDRRLKTDIERVGTLDSGLAVYRYRYKAGGPFVVGVMADEVADHSPGAYLKGGAGNGFDAVDYSKL